MEKVYIPYLINQREIIEKDGINKLKNKICQTFSALDEEGFMYLGTVKKVEIIIKKQTDKIYNRIGRTYRGKNNKDIISAFVRFIPATSKAAIKRIQDIKTENGLKVTYDTNKNLFWIVLQQRKQKNKINIITEKNIDISDLFENLSCNDGPSRKRMRI
jgi:hypothetical protein